MTSLIESYEGLHVKCVKAANLNVALAHKLTEARKEKGGLQDKVRELEKKVATLEASLSTSEATVEMALRIQAFQEVGLKLKDEKISELEAELAKYLAELSKAASDSFNNALEQARILNPNLVMEGMSFLNIAKDGEIVPYQLEDGGMSPRGNLRRCLRVELPRPRTPEQLL